MGCDIHAYGERNTPNGWELVTAAGDYDGRNYDVFGFLAGVRNYSAIPPICEPRGLPEDISYYVRAAAESWDGDGHNHSWLSIAELRSVDYGKTIEDRRDHRMIAPGFYSGAETADEGQGLQMTLRSFLGAYYFEWLDTMQSHGVERVVFWFDN